MQDSKAAAGGRGLTEAERRFRDAKARVVAAERAAREAFQEALEAAAAVRAERRAAAMHEDAA